MSTSTSQRNTDGTPPGHRHETPTEHRTFRSPDHRVIVRDDPGPGSADTAFLPRPAAGDDGRTPQSADPTTQVQAHRDPGSSGSASDHDEPDDVIVAIKARVVETLFGEAAHPPMLGRYVVLGTLGQGGMGTVLEAFDRTLDRKVAIKVLHEDLGHEHTARLLREARALAKLSHPNVVQVFEADTTGGQTYVAMELVQGRTLRSWIRQHPRPDWRQCVEVFIQAGQGLAAAHKSGLVHRDFKPSNAIIDQQGRARVLDFGLARRAEIDITDDAGPDREGGPTEDDLSVDPPAQPRVSTGTTPVHGEDPPAFAQALTETGTVMGTPAYMPPEQMMGREANASSDQFSFCVSLYEAVYGERPFEGSTLTQRMDSMTREGVRPAPKGSAVPTRLRTVLLRGLAADPDQRWPSMDVLLQELGTLVTPRTRRWMAVGLTAGLVTLGGGLALGQYAQVKDRCTGARAQMDGVWDDDRRQQVRTAILGTEISFAPSTWASIEPGLDAYARDWEGTHTEACEATSVRGEQSEEALDLRMRCLGQRRTALRATVDVLADANAEVVENAIELVAGLPSLARCNDLQWLEQHKQLVPPPEDPVVAAAVQAQRARLADIEAMQKAGRYADALAAVEPLVQQAEALGYPPVWAEALHRRGALRNHNGQYTEAEQDLRKAHALAVAHHHDPAALDTAQELSIVVGLQLARYAEGQQWGEMVALPLAQRSGEPLQEATSLNNLGIVLQNQGDYDNARRYHQQALAIQQVARGPHHPLVATSLDNLGTVFQSQGDYDNARSYHQQALAIRQEALGPDHPFVATSLNNLGNVFFRQGDFEPARDHYQRALAIHEEALGPHHQLVAAGLNNLGSVFESQGDLDDARVHYQRSLAILEKTLGPDHPRIAHNLSNLGGVLQGLGDFDDARVYYERSLAILEKTVSSDHPLVASNLNNLGYMFRTQGDLDNARVHYQRSLAIFEKTLGPDHPYTAHPLMGLATVALATDDPESARAHAERAVSIREAATVGPRVLAEARFVLARALWSTPSERERARALAHEAREAHAELGQRPDDGPDDDLAEIDAWLATHRVQ